jgi:hypothetical protein
MLSSGLYGLNLRREGFYAVNAIGYEYTVNAGWDAVYSSVRLERCPNGNCDANLRKPAQIVVCE